MTETSQGVVLGGMLPDQKVVLPAGVDVVGLVKAVLRTVTSAMEMVSAYEAVEAATGLERRVVSVLCHRVFGALHARAIGVPLPGAVDAVDAAVAAAVATKGGLVADFFPVTTPFPHLPADLPPGMLTYVPWSGRTGAGVVDPRAWVTTDFLEDIGTPYATLRAAAGRTGLYPVVVDFTDDGPCPWGPQVPLAEVDALDALDAETALRDIKAQYTDFYGVDDDGVLSRWSGLTAAARGAADRAAADYLADSVVRDFGAAPRTAPRNGLALVPAQRSADVLAVTGWTGAANHTATKTQLTAVLRSWEERFGARLVVLSSAQIGLTIAHPPTDLEHATAIAHEHLIFCPDSTYQGRHETFDEYAASLLDLGMWVFWWD
ncbi:DUF4253 domain-containing protein [Promicromonospora aerolata]|uniref:DUF4253 domain-containing protein n=1 Tax=Promicromonospora aerolata TaxID=195749 RepID=A0ABW4VEK0_9MICO